jgi:hypothetical protein
VSSPFFILVFYRPHIIFIYVDGVFTCLFFHFHILVISINLSIKIVIINMGYKEINCITKYFKILQDLL